MRTGRYWAPIPVNHKIATLTRCTDCAREFAVILGHQQAIPDRCADCERSSDVKEALRSGQVVRIGGTD